MMTKALTSVERALAVLGAFQADDTSLSLAELARRTRFYKSTILRLARSLQKAHFLVRLESGRYQLGSAVVRLGEICKRGTTLDGLIMPVLRKLVEETGESATLYVRKGEHRFCLRRVDSQRTLRDHVREGDLIPLSVGAPGRVFLHFDSGIAKHMRRGAVPASIRTSAALPLPIVTRGEYDSELAAIACGVFGPPDELLGVVSLSGPINRFRKREAQRMGGILLEACRRLTVELGGDVRHYAPRRSGDSS
jgi:DNA-binding IclR family transcriptional regulator